MALFQMLPLFQLMMDNKKLKEERLDSYQQRFGWMRRYNTLDDYPQIKGFDFEQKFDFEKFIESFAVTGIQATEMSRGIEIINMMLDDEAKIYLSMTSNSCSHYYFLSPNPFTN